MLPGHVQLWPVFVNKVLLEHGDAHLYCLHLTTGGAEELQQGSLGLQSQTVTLWPFAGVCQPLRPTGVGTVLEA